MPETPAPPVSARVLAVERLLRVEGDGAYVARLAGGAGRVDAETARAASDYVAGVTRQRRWLDFLLGRYARGGLGALDPELLQTLRVGAYDLVVRGTAPHAAVNEAVETARALLHRGAGGYANAVLRALARDLADLPAPASGRPRRRPRRPPLAPDLDGPPVARGVGRGGDGAVPGLEQRAAPGSPSAPRTGRAGWGRWSTA